MATTNYKETSVTGSAWQRCYQVVVDNSLEGQKSIRFDEEQVVQMADGNVFKALGPLPVNYDPTATIDVLDPSTGQSTGKTITHADLYDYLYSAYMQAAAARDAAATSSSTTTSSTTTTTTA